jgi:hypothetical protein
MNDRRPLVSIPAFAGMTEKKYYQPMIQFPIRTATERATQDAAAEPMIAAQKIILAAVSLSTFI